MNQYTVLVRVRYRYAVEAAPSSTSGWHNASYGGYNVYVMSPYYNGGTLYRGMVMDDREADRLYINRWSPGSTQNLGGRIQSFSDKRSVSESFGNWDYVGRGNTSVMLVLEGNKTIPGVAHLSFQRGEREALAPLSLEFEVVRSEITYSSNGGRRIVYYLKDKKK